MIEAIAEADDEADARPISRRSALRAELLRAALRRATVAGQAVPVLCGAAFRNKGVQPLLDAVVDYLPSPNDIPPVVGKDSEGQARPSGAPPTPSRSRRWRSRS